MILCGWSKKALTCKGDMPYFRVSKNWFPHVSTLPLSFSGFMMAIWVWPVYPLAQVARSKIQLFLLFLHFADHAYTGKLFYVVLGSRLQIGQQCPPAMATVVPDLLQLCRCTTRNPFFKALQSTAAAPQTSPNNLVL